MTFCVEFQCRANPAGATRGLHGQHHKAARERLEQPRRVRGDRPDEVQRRRIFHRTVRGPEKRGSARSKRTLCHDSIGSSIHRRKRQDCGSSHCIALIAFPMLFVLR